MSSRRVGFGTLPEVSLLRFTRLVFFADLPVTATSCPIGLTTRKMPRPRERTTAQDVFRRLPLP